MSSPTLGTNIQKKKSLMFGVMPAACLWSCTYSLIFSWEKCLAVFAVLLYPAENFSFRICFITNVMSYSWRKWFHLGPTYSQCWFIRSYSTVKRRRVIYYECVVLWVCGSCGAPGRAHRRRQPTSERESVTKPQDCSVETFKENVFTWKSNNRFN